MKKLISIIIFLLIISSSVYAGTTNKYYEIDFTYTNIINNKPYTEEATLLRDKAWLEQNNITKAGDTLILNIPEFGVVNANSTARSVELSDANPEEIYSNNQSMVTGTFKHFATDVREYTLRDIKTNQIQTIQATPNHAFYVQNRTAFNKALNQQSHFIEIQNITPEDHMLNEAGNSVELVCDNNICGKQLVRNKQPIAVYNLEIYKQHQYLVVSDKVTNGFKLSDAVLVHNVCKVVEYGSNEWKKLYQTYENDSDVSYTLNIKDLKNPEFSPKIGKIDDNPDLYTFKASNTLTEQEKSTLDNWKKWDDIPHPGISWRNKEYSYLSNGFIDNIKARSDDSNTFHSLVYREDKLVAVSQFKVFSTDITTSYTISDPDNLIDQTNKISGFGAKLKYTGIQYGQENFLEVTQFRSTAFSHASAKINLKLGFLPPGYSFP